MNDVFDFLVKRQMVFVFLAVLGGATLFFYFAMIEGLGHYRTSLLSGVIMAVVLAVVTTIRVLIFFYPDFPIEILLKISRKNLTAQLLRGLISLFFC